MNVISVCVTGRTENKIIIEASVKANINDLRPLDEVANSSLKEGRFLLQDKISNCLMEVNSRGIKDLNQQVRKFTLIYEIDFFNSETMESNIKDMLE